jgi:hypothetical protein
MSTKREAPSTSTPAPPPKSACTAHTRSRRRLAWHWLLSLRFFTFLQPHSAFQPRYTSKMEPSLTYELIQFSDTLGVVALATLVVALAFGAFSRKPHR